jgi:hypothetical protein
MGLPAKQLSNTYWLPWYNSSGDLDTQLRIANVSGIPTSVTVTIGETPRETFPLGAGESVRKSYAGTNDGPVEIHSDQDLVVAQRMIYKVQGANTSFSEVMALPAPLLSTRYWLPWYNNVGLDTQLRLGVP